MLRLRPDPVLCPLMSRPTGACNDKRDNYGRSTPISQGLSSGSRLSGKAHGAQRYHRGDRQPRGAVYD